MIKAVLLADLLRCQPLVRFVLPFTERGPSWIGNFISELDTASNNTLTYRDSHRGILLSTSIRVSLDAQPGEGDIKLARNSYIGFRKD